MNRRNVARASSALALLIFPAIGYAHSTNNHQTFFQKIQGLPWVVGPKRVAIGVDASFEVPSGYRFLPPPYSTQFLYLNGNPDFRGGYYILSKNSYAWFSVFHFLNAGYVKDKEKITPHFINKTYQILERGTREENVLRKKKGLAILGLHGWYIKPNYNPVTHRLEWATLLSTPGRKGDVVDFNTRFLGRYGVMSVVLVDDQSRIAKDIPVFNGVMQGFGFDPGSRYSDHESGDKTAEYGLMGLIAGGAAAVAVKTGLFATMLAALVGFGKALIAIIVGFWKVIMVAVAGAATSLKRFFRRLFRKEE